MENFKEWQGPWGKDDVMTEENRCSKETTNQNKRRWNDSYIQKGEACNLNEAMTYLYSELQKDGYRENMIPESEYIPSFQKEASFSNLLTGE